MVAYAYTITALAALAAAAPTYIAAGSNDNSGIDEVLLRDMRRREPLLLVCVSPQGASWK